MKNNEIGSIYSVFRQDEQKKKLPYVNSWKKPCNPDLSVLQSF